MHQEGCSACEEIRILEESARQLRAAIVDCVQTELVAVAVRNADRWDDFEFARRIPLIGRFLVGGREAPLGLEPDPEPWKDPWYAKKAAELKATAITLDGAKDAHLEHWGDDLVYPGYTPGYRSHLRGPTLRRMVVRHKDEGAWALLPEKYILRPGEKIPEFRIPSPLHRAEKKEGWIARVMRVRRSYARA